MPVQTKKSPLFAKLGAKLDQAVQKHAADQTDYGIMDLPGGIKNGVAQLVECGFFLYKGDTQAKQANGKSAAGEYYFRAAGVMKDPEYSPEGAPVRGLQTSIMINMFDTKAGPNAKIPNKITTQEEHVEEVLNEMRKLGGDEYTHGATGADLENLAAGLKDAAPHFWVSTREGQKTVQYPNPKVFTSWNGTKGLENYVGPADGGAQVQDNSGGGAAPSNDEQQGESAAEGDDIDALLAAAGDDTDEAAMNAAQARLKELALEAGVEEGPDEDAPPHTFNGAPDFATVVGWIQNGAPEAPAEKTAAAAPEKGGTCNYGILDTKTKKVKPVQCEIITVNATKETLTLKNLTTGKPVADKAGKALAVAWADVELT